MDRADDSSEEDGWWIFMMIVLRKARKMDLRYSLQLTVFTLVFVVGEKLTHLNSQLEISTRQAQTEIHYIRILSHHLTLSQHNFKHWGSKEQNLQEFSLINKKRLRIFLFPLLYHILHTHVCACNTRDGRRSIILISHHYTHTIDHAYFVSSLWSNPIEMPIYLCIFTWTTFFPQTRLPLLTTFLWATLENRHLWRKWPIECTAQGTTPSSSFSFFSLPYYSYLLDHTIPPIILMSPDTLCSLVSFLRLLSLSLPKILIYFDRILVYIHLYEPYFLL